MSISFFGSTRSPYYIYALDFRQTSAGIRVLHSLCHALNELGEEAYIANTTVTSQALRTPLLTNNVVRNHFLRGRIPIAVYPEVVAGNPFAAPIVARWLLNKPGHISGDTHIDSEELIFYFGEWCLPNGVTGHSLHLPSVDTDVFHNQQPVPGGRKGICYYANKYLHFGGQIDPVLLNIGSSLGLENRYSKAELAEILRSSEVMYCYEPSSLIYEALACGCPVLIVPTAYWEQNGAPEVLSTPGVMLATAPDALLKATAALKQYNSVEATKAHMRASWWQVENFISVTRKARKACLNTAPRLTTPWLLPQEDREQSLDEIKRLYAGKVAVDCSTKHDIPSGPTSLSITDAIAVGKLHSRKLPSIELIIVATESGQFRLSSTLASVGKQGYPALAVTVIAPPSVIDVAAGNGRRCLPQSENHWLAAREALAASTAQWAGIVRSGDSLAPGALAAFAGRMINPATVDVLYSDTADSAVDGGQAQPHFLPAFDIDLVRAGDFPFGLLLARSERWRESGGWRVAPTGLDTLDAVLRLHERCGATAIGHVAGTFLIRHRNNQPYLPTDPQIIALRRQIVLEHLARCSITGEVVPGLREELVHVRYPVAQPPKVSLIIPTKDNGAGLEACIRSALEATDYPDLECLIIDNGTAEPSARAYLDNLVLSAPGNFRVAAFAQPFNFGAVANAAVGLASGDLLLFLHDDVEALQPGWIHALVEQCLRPGVGMVGGRLLARNSMIAEAGIVPMQTGLSDNPFAGLAPDARVTASCLQAVHQVSAISSACMMVRRDVFQQVGGMDAINFPARTADIDFCLKVRAAGHRILWTPYATLLHDSDGTQRGNKHDNNALLAKWGKLLTDDPHFNPYLALDSSRGEAESDLAFIPDSINWHPMTNIFASTLSGSDVAQQRIREPIQGATALAIVRGRVGGFLPLPVQLKKLDIDVIHCPAPLTTHQLREMALYRQLLNCRTILDIDSLIDETFSAADPFRHIRLCLRGSDPHVDHFVTSSAWLASQLPQWSKKLTVIPDTVRPTRWDGLLSPSNRSGKIRIGWHGKPADLEAITTSILNLAAEVDWVFLGSPPALLAPATKERHQMVSFDDFPQKLASLNLDLAILPLAMTVQNQCRSHLPALEYGMLGIPVIATNIEAYQTGLPITLVENTASDWETAIRECISSRELLQERGRSLRQHILENWTFDKYVDQWQSVWAP